MNALERRICNLESKVAPDMYVVFLCWDDTNEHNVRYATVGDVSVERSGGESFQDFESRIEQACREKGMALSWMDCKRILEINAHGEPENKQ